MSAKIKSVKITDYCSHVPESIIIKILNESKCDRSGTLELTLKPGRELIQRGPYLLPPIRWLESFELNAEFHIVCDVQ